MKFLSLNKKSKYISIQNCNDDVPDLPDLPACNHDDPGGDGNAGADGVQDVAHLLL